MRNRVGRFLAKLGLGGTIMMAGLSAAGAQGAPTVEDLFAALNAENYRAAHAMAVELTDPAGPNLILFVEATALVANGNCEAGQPRAEAVVAQRPDFLPAYDLIGVCMAKAGEALRAARIFRGIASRLPDGPDREALLARAAAFTPEKPMSVTLSLDAQPTSNLNRGTDETHVGPFRIDETSRREAGVQVSAEARLEKPLHIGEKTAINGAVVGGVAYESLSRRVMPFIRTEATFRMMLDPKTSVGLTPYVELRFDELDFDSVRAGVRASLNRTISSQTEYAVETDIAYVDDQTFDGRDGISARLSGTVIHRPTTDDKLTFNAHVVREHRQSDTASKTDLSTDLEWEHRFESGLVTAVTAGAGVTFHDGNAPLTADRQRDIRASAGIALSHEDIMIGTIRPEIGYRYTRQWSNDPFSRYKAHDVTLKLKTAF